MKRKKAQDFPQELLDLYDGFAHGKIDRRGFLDRAGRFAVGALTATAILEMLQPNYSYANQAPADDARIKTSFLDYDSPQGHGKMRGYFAHPANLEKPCGGVIVIHENRGLNPYVEDVTRRVAIEGFLAFAPDALTPLGGYPGNDDDGRKLQRQLDGEKITEDFVAAAHFLSKHESFNGNLGAVGFCFGGRMANILAVRLSDEIKAAVPFYGGQPTADEASHIRAALQLHYAGLDKRVNAGWPDYETALKAHGVDYEAHIYPGVNHGFHNDTTPRYDAEAAHLAWDRTIAFFNKHL